MSQRALTLSITIPTDALTDGVGAAVARLLTASASTWFRPVGASGASGSTAWQLGDRQLAPTWHGEERGAADAMSSLVGDPTAALIAELAGRLAAGDEAELSVWGALRVRTRADGEPRWLARWWPVDGEGHALVSLAMRTDAPHLRLAITWGLWGFPLTAVQPATPRAEYRALDDARRNRAELLPAIGAAIAALGVDAAGCGWGLEVQLASDHRWVGGHDVAAILETCWLPALRRGQADAVVEPLVDDEADAIVAALAGPLDACAVMLGVLLTAPNPDPRVVAAVAALTEDPRPAVLQVPYRIGPIKLLAELVAARLRAARGADPRAYVWSTPPLTATELEQRERAGALPPLALAWSPDDPHALTLARYLRLVEAGLLDEQGYAIDERHLVSDLAPPEVDVDVPAPSSPSEAPAPDEAQLVADLDAGGDRRAWALEDLLTEPCLAPAVTAAIARALDDRTPCGLAGALVGEIRLLAAAALAAARFRSADLTPVEVTFTVPLSSAQLLDARAAHPEAPPADDYDGRLHLFAWLRDRVGLPEARRALRHPIDLLGLDRPA